MINLTIDVNLTRLNVYGVIKTHVVVIRRVFGKSVSETATALPVLIENNSYVRSAFIFDEDRKYDFKEKRKIHIDE